MAERTWERYGYENWLTYSGECQLDVPPVSPGDVNGTANEWPQWIFNAFQWMTTGWPLYSVLWWLRSPTRICIVHRRSLMRRRSTHSFILGLRHHNNHHHHHNPLDYSDVFDSFNVVRAVPRDIGTCQEDGQPLQCSYSIRDNKSNGSKSRLQWLPPSAPSPAFPHATVVASSLHAVLCRRALLAALPSGCL